jgi:hypothetical protein
MEFAQHIKRRLEICDCNLSDFIICIDIFKRTQHIPCDRLLFGQLVSTSYVGHYQASYTTK